MKTLLLTIILSLTSAYAGFSLAGGVITQSDTDTDLSGLSAITGVQLIEEGVRTNYLVPYPLVINGDLSFDGRSEKLSIDVDSGQCLALYGSLSIDGRVTSGAYSVPVRYEALALHSGSTTANGETSFPFFVDQSASLTLQGVMVTIDVDSGTHYGNRIEGGAALNWQDVYFKCNKYSRFFEGGVSGDASNASFQNYFMELNAVAFYGTPALDSGLNLISGNYLRLSANGGDVLNFEALSPSNRFKNWGNSQIYLTNNFYGSSQSGGNNNAATADTVFTTIRRGLVGTFKTPDGAPAVGARMYIQGSVHGTAVDNPSTLLDESVAQGYVITCDAAGDLLSEQYVTLAQLRNLGGGDQNNPNIDYFNKAGAAGDDVFDVAYYGYNYLIQTISDFRLGNDGTVNARDVSQVLSIDPLITETDSSIVASYTSQDDAYTAYDALKYVLTQNYTGEKETWATRSEDTLISSYDIVINGTGSGLPAFDGSTITLFSSGFSGNIQTTGTVTGKEYVSGAIIDATQDTTLSEINGATFSIYPSESDMYAATNAIATDVTSWAGLYASVPNTLYISAVFGNTRLPFTVVVNQGVNTFDSGVAGALGSIEANLEIINDNVKEAAARRPAIKDLD